MTDKMAEEVMVVPTKTLFGENNENYFQGFVHADSTIGKRIKEKLECFTFKTRGEVEENPEYKQIIPYCMMIYRLSLFTVQRLPTQGEERLHHKTSIGIGGHMNRMGLSLPFEPLFERNVQRELNEELEHNIQMGTGDARGFINWDQDDVGKVHFGIATFFFPDRDKIKVRETDKMVGEFKQIHKIHEKENWETWSRIVLDYCF